MAQVENVNGVACKRLILKGMKEVGEVVDDFVGGAAAAEM